MKTLSITIDDKLYQSLRSVAPSGKISKFISHALEKCLSQHQHELYHAYTEASHDREREDDLKVWDQINIEDWNKLEN